MSLKGFAERAQSAFDTLADAASPIAALALDDAHFVKSFDADAEISYEIEELGELKLAAGASAALHLTRSAQAPTELDSINSDPNERELAYLSLVAKGNASMGLKADVDGLSGVSVGLDAGANVTFAQHRRYSQQTAAVDALRDLLGHLATPYDTSALSALAPGEVLQVDLGG